MKIGDQFERNLSKKSSKRSSTNYEVVRRDSFNELTKRRRASFESTSSLNIASIKVLPLIPALRQSSIKAERCSTLNSIDDTFLDFPSTSFHVVKNEEIENMSLFDEVISPFKRRTISKEKVKALNRSFSTQTLVVSRRSTLDSEKTKNALWKSPEGEISTQSNIGAKVNLLQEQIADVEELEVTPEKPYRLSNSWARTSFKTILKSPSQFLEDDLFLTMDVKSLIKGQDHLQMVKENRPIGLQPVKSEATNEEFYSNASLFGFVSASQLIECPKTQENEFANLTPSLEIFYTPPKPFASLNHPTCSIKRELFDDLEESPMIGKWNNPSTQETIIKDHSPPIAAQQVRRRGTIESDITIVDGPTQLAARRLYEIDESSQASSRSSLNGNVEKRVSMSLFATANADLPEGLDEVLNSSNSNDASSSHFRRRSLTGLPLALQNYFSSKRSEQNIERRKRQSKNTALQVEIDEGKTRKCWGLEFLSTSRGEIIRSTKSSNRPTNRIHSPFNSLQLPNGERVILDPTFL